jgi:hypothetical protein
VFPRATPVVPDNVVSTKRYRLPESPDQFPENEPPSFGSRLTPVVPIPAWPSELATTRPPAFQSQQPPPPREAADDYPEIEAFPLSRVSHPELHLDPVQYPPDESPLEEPEEEFIPPRSLFRSIFTKLLFTLIFSGVLVLLAYELSLKFGIPWLDVRRLIAAARGQ